MSKPYVSIVIPVYNEQENLDALFTRLTSVMDKLGKPYEILFTNDGSRDRSGGRQSQKNDHQGRNPCVRKSDRGKHPARSIDATKEKRCTQTPHQRIHTLKLLCVASEPKADQRGPSHEESALPLPSDLLRPICLALLNRDVEFEFTLHIFAQSLFQIIIQRGIGSVENKVRGISGHIFRTAALL